MSLQSARDFLERINSDHAWRERLEAASNLEARWKIIQAAGIDFTREEFEQIVEEMTAAASPDLTSEDLDEISGGVGRCACKGNRYNYVRL